MSHTKLPRAIMLLLAALFCLATGPSAPASTDAVETARRIAAEADDQAVGLAARQESLRKLEDAARIFLEAGETLEAARSLNRAGRLQLILNAPQDALDCHRRALDLLKSAPSAEAEVDGLNGLGAAYLLLGDGRAEESLDESLALSEQSGYTKGRAQALLTLSDLQNYRNHALALQTAQSSLALWQDLGDRRGAARAYAQIGLCHLAQNNLAESEQNLRQALQIWHELNNAPEQAGVLIYLGFVEYRRGEWQNEISLMTEAQGLIDEESEPEKMGQTAAGMAEAFRESGMPDVAINHNLRALDYYRRTQDPHLVWDAVWELGRTYYFMGDYADALTQLRRSLEGVAADGLEAAQTYHSLGGVYMATGEYADALRYLQSALDIYTRTVNPKEVAEVGAMMARVYERQGQTARAREGYTRSLESFDKLSDRVNQAAVFYALGRLELNGGNYAAAENYLWQSIEATEDIRRSPTSRDLTTAFSATVHERYEAYVECLMLERQTEPSHWLDARAFETSERGRARSLAELLRRTGTSLLSGLDPQLAEREKSLRQTLRAKEDYKVRLLGGAYRKDELDALDDELSRLDGEYKQVSETIRERYPSYEQMTRPAAWDLKRIQEQVVSDEQTVLLEYSLGDERSYVWAVTRDRITSRELPAQAQIDAAAAKVYGLLSIPPDSKREEELASAERDLSEMVLSPVGAELAGKGRVIVVADGGLNYVPFQILPSPSPGAEPLVADYEVVNAPSASVLGELREERARRRPAPKLLAAFGDPVSTEDYQERKGSQGGGQLAALKTTDAKSLLPNARAIEIKGDSFDSSALGRLFYAKLELANLRKVTRDSGDAFVAEDFAATREQLLSTDLTQYAILHFATHGLLDPKRPENSGLILSTVDRDGHARDGFVRLQDIYSLRAPVDLVVLSACRTALGKDVRGEGLIGLTRGFMYAGASSVVSSLWKVNDEATAELMKRFYSNMLQKGMTPAAALRDAQNDMRRDPQWRSPYYWAAFTLQGEYSQTIRTQPPTLLRMDAKSFALALLLLASMACAALLYRRRRATHNAS